MADMRDEPLVSLEHDDFAVAEGEPDPRGWNVVTTDQRTVGTVDDLLADPSALKVRYLTIDLDSDVVGSRGTDRTVRVPIERARVHPEEHRVLLDLPATGLAALESGSPMTSTSSWREDQTRMTRAAEELRIGKRRVERGEVEVSKHVESERVREPVTLRGEDVDVKRRPVSGSTATEARIGSDEIRVPIIEEEAVVEKRPVVKEEVVITKHPTERQETVESDLREERVDVERRGEEERGERDRGRRR